MFEKNNAVGVINMVNIKWDHTVHYVNDLGAAIKNFQEQGLHAFMGGSHKQWGTYNALSYFDLCYIEFLSVEDWERAESYTEPNVLVQDSVKLLPDREELSRVALRTDDIEAVRKHLLEFDLDVSPIMDGKRLDTKGNLIEWKMMTIAGDFQGLPYPFVLQWKETDGERRERMIGSDAIKEHPAGNVSIKEAVFHVSDPVAVAAHWKELFGFELAVNEDGMNSAELKVEEQSFVFKKSSENKMHSVVFHTDNEALRGTFFKIGQGEYMFK